MCRWIAYISTNEMLLSDIVLSPSNSLIEQSIDASFLPGFTQRYNHIVNADGFGLGWYHKNGVNPAVFKDTQPAWSNVNLREICTSTKSNCVISHVRAASPGMGVYIPNVHPFKAGRLLFCHNGAIQRIKLIRRKLLAQVTEEVFLSIQGTTDSELVFALMLTNLSKDGGSDESPFTQTAPFGHDRLYAAMKRTIRQLEHVLKESGIHDATNTPSRMNFSLTDGETLVCSRFCDKYPLIPPPSLYFAFGDPDLMQKELTNPDEGSAIDDDQSEEDFFDEKQDAIEKDLSQQMSLPGKLLSEVDKTECAFIVASNPLTKENKDSLQWHRIAANSIISYTRGSIPRLYKLQVGGARKPEDYAFFMVDL